jgi:hypothetical protein
VKEMAEIIARLPAERAAHILANSPAITDEVRREVDLIRKLKAG